MSVAVDVACGPGGFSEGWARAAGRRDNIIGFDFDATARQTYEAAGFKAYHGDLFDTDDFVRRVVEATGGKRPQIVIGSSSCKGWTNAGQRQGADDQRDTFLPWMRAVGRLQPDVAIMENVSRVTKHPHWLDGLNAIGMPLVGIWTLKAYLYGAPTKRERTFWLWRCDGVWPVPPVPVPVKCEFGSIISQSGGQIGAVRLPQNSYLTTRVEGVTANEKYQNRWRMITVEEALCSQGAAGKHICGDARSVAQQIADMIPPPLAEAVIRAACKGVLEKVAM